MKPFKNKFLWNVFVSIAMLPVAFLAGTVIYGLVFIGIFGFSMSTLNSWVMYAFCVCFYLYTVYQIFTDGFRNKGTS